VLRAALDESGSVVVAEGRADRHLLVSQPVALHRWARMVLTVTDSGSVRLDVVTGDQPGDSHLATASEVLSAGLSAADSLVLGATMSGGAPSDCFNGRLAAPSLHDENGELLAGWDFSERMHDQVAVDVGPHGLHGTLVNRPGRALLGPSWDRTTLRWTDDPGQWDAVHLHEDDLDDAGWEADFTVSAPQRSGLYAVRLTQNGETYHLPFVVGPSEPRSRVLVVLPTNTYLAYGNEHLWEGERGEAHQRVMSFPISLDSPERILRDVPGLGRSLYDQHADGSGVMYASRRRPLTNLQPDHVHWLTAGRRHLSADLLILGWLESLGVAHDVATDEDVDREGTALLLSYDVVLTGSHPEYPTAAEYDAFEDYLRTGGRVMYLGANGFYWVTSFVDSERSAIEVRRGYAAQRNWSSHPAELHHSSTGEQGAAWRHRGRDQNPVFGIGMAAYGWGPASPYERTPESYDREVSWVFDGVLGSTVGAQGMVLGGAAGDELDHADPDRGTPETATVLLSSRHGDLYYPHLETLTESGSVVPGSANPRVRADVVLLDHPGGGRVFSTGSICWVGSLGSAGYDNDVARVTTNVLMRFLAKAAPRR
jgi:N,N-dimethylformamidase